MALLEATEIKELNDAFFFKYNVISLRPTFIVLKHYDIGMKKNKTVWSKVTQPPIKLVYIRDRLKMNINSYNNCYIYNTHHWLVVLNNL